MYVRLCVYNHGHGYGYVQGSYVLRVYGFDVDVKKNVDRLCGGDVDAT